MPEQKRHLRLLRLADRPRQRRAEKRALAAGPISSPSSDWGERAESHWPPQDPPIPPPSSTSSSIPCFIKASNNREACNVVLVVEPPRRVVCDWRDFQKPGGLAAAPCASLWAHICLAVLLEKAGNVDLSMAHCALSSAFSPVCYILHHAVFGSIEIHSTYPNKMAEYTANSAALLQGLLCTTPMI
ncbi:hypothetical protein SRHO_G00134520 [Serrasalmus rhombeus]